MREFYSENRLKATGKVKASLGIRDKHFQKRNDEHCQDKKIRMHCGSYI